MIDINDNYLNWKFPIKMTPHPYVLSQSYKRVTNQIYVQKFQFYAVRLKIRVNRPIMKFDDKNNICVLLEVFYDNSVLKPVMSI